MRNFSVLYDCFVKQYSCLKQFWTSCTALCWCKVVWWSWLFCFCFIGQFVVWNIQLTLLCARGGHTQPLRSFDGRLHCCLLFHMMICILDLDSIYQLINGSTLCTNVHGFSFAFMYVYCKLLFAVWNVYDEHRKFLIFYYYSSTWSFLPESVHNSVKQSDMNPCCLCWQLWPKPLLKPGLQTLN